MIFVESSASMASKSLLGRVNQAGLCSPSKDGELLLKLHTLVESLPDCRTVVEC